MDKRTIIIICMVAFVIFVVLALSIWLIIRHKKSRTPQEAPKATQDPNSPFPPCFELSHTAKETFRILMANGVKDAYARLLDVYSLVLCQQQDRCAAAGSPTIKEKSAQLEAWGADANNKEAKDIVKSIVRNADQTLERFLVLATHLSTVQIRAIEKDDRIPKTSKEALVGFNSQFYRSHYAVFNNPCDPATPA